MCITHRMRFLHNHSHDKMMTILFSFLFTSSEERKQVAPGLYSQICRQYMLHSKTETTRFPENSPHRPFVRTFLHKSDLTSELRMNKCTFSNRSHGRFSDLFFRCNSRNINEKLLHSGSQCNQFYQTFYDLLFYQMRV